MFAGQALAQPTSLEAVDAELQNSDRLRDYRVSPTRQLTVLSETIAPEEIDRAVLNRLMQEIVNNPEATQQTLRINAAQMADIFISISNARAFINDSEPANLRAMCRAWNQSGLRGEDRIQAALDAYIAREKFTRDFIQKYYDVVLLEIESFLPDTSKPAFNNYMQDRRRRMASSGASSRRAVVSNIESGSKTVQFHCRDQQANLP